MLYFICILFSGIFMLVSLIIALVKYSNNGKGAGKWLLGFFTGLLILGSSIFIFTKKVINKADSFVNTLANTQFHQIDILDSMNNLQQKNRDSMLQSKRISALIALEKDKGSKTIPSEFYTYLGFRDYFRLPLRYPYSLHCMDSLGCADLFNEENVTQFDINDNGEQPCNLGNIHAFNFNQDFLIGSKIKIEPERITVTYFAYDFNKKEEKEFKTQKELLKYASQNGFGKEIEFFNSKSYYKSF